MNGHFKNSSEKGILAIVVLESSSGKLLVYASSFASYGKRLKPVSNAAERMARFLKLSFELRTFRKKFEPIYVYYKGGDEEPVPIYCSNNGQLDIGEICAALRNMMFVLSFHPKHSALKHVRKEIMQFS